MRFLTLVLAVAAILGTAALPARAADAWQLDVSGSSYDEECLTYCLQGLVNRDAPRLFLNTASIFWSYPDADRYWLRYLEEKKGFHFTHLENLRAAIAAFRGEVKGLALYDPAQDASRFVALTLCAQRNLLPVTPAMLQYQTPALTPGSAACFRDLPVVEDLRGRFADDLAAYRWALKNLMPACSKELAFSAGHSHDDTFLGGDRAITIGLDYPIAQKAFVFNLSPVGGSWMNSGKPHPGYPEQAELFDTVMRRLRRPAGIYGWAEPEAEYCRRVSAGGNYVMCDAAPNLSFWAKLPASGDLRLPVHAPRTVRLENKYYLTFQTNEGDTPKILAALQGGAWLSPRRGSAPVAWGINPEIAVRFPALFEYFVSTATAQDTFFAGCSGAGYCLPWHMPNLDDFARHTRRRLQAFGPNVVDIWEGPLRPEMLQRYNRTLQTDCFTHQSVGAAQNLWLDDGTPVLSSDRQLFYYDPDGRSSVEKLRQRIEAVAAMHEPPFFILCYGGCGPGLFNQIATLQKELPKERFAVVGAQEMALLARQAGAFTVSLGSTGIAPGETIPLEITLRNPDGAQGAAGEISWELPAGWKASETIWHHPAIARGKALRHTVRLTTGSQPERARIRCRDSRTGAERTAAVDVFAETVLADAFAAPGSWRESGATLQRSGKQARITTADPFGSIRRTLSLDFDREPLVEITVPKVKNRWSLKLNDGSLATDIVLQPDTDQTGHFTYDLAATTGWHGTKQMELILFAVGKNAPMQVDSLRIHYRR